jgi:hypothetical protein
VAGLRVSFLLSVIGSLRSGEVYGKRALVRRAIRLAAVAHIPQARLQRLTEDIPVEHLVQASGIELKRGDEIAHQLLMRGWPVGVRVMHRNNIDTGRPRSDKIQPHGLRQIKETLDGARMLLQ